MKYVCLLFAICLAACSAQDPALKSPNNDNETNNSENNENNAAPNNAAPNNTSNTSNNDAPDMGDGGGDMPIPPDFGDIPDAIDSTGASFSGQLPAQGSVSVQLSVFQADRVTMWLRQTGGTNWNPSLFVFRDGQTEPLVWGDPSGNEDASIPYRAAELADGYEFWFTDTYTLELANPGDTDGEFEFTLECRGGPCAIVSGDADVDGTPDAEDDCPYQPESCGDPYSGLSGDDLEDAIRADHGAHVMMNYVEARIHMFSWIDKDNGQVEGLYTGERVTTDEIPDPAQMNTEHGWPQSRSGGDPASESDLHHLYPTKPEANSERASLYFGEVVDPDWQRGGSAKGRNNAGDTVFEPRDEVKGDLARTLFYYAVIYQVDMRDEEEAVLRQWNVDDPPDERERRRHQSIANVQRDRNPFVDFPALADRISTF